MGCGGMGVVIKGNQGEVVGAKYEFIEVN